MLMHYLLSVICYLLYTILLYFTVHAEACEALVLGRAEEVLLPPGPDARVARWLRP